MTERFLIVSSDKDTVSFYFPGIVQCAALRRSGIKRNLVAAGFTEMTACRNLAYRLYVYTVCTDKFRINGTGIVRSRNSKQMRIAKSICVRWCPAESGVLFFGT